MPNIIRSISLVSTQQQNNKSISQPQRKPIMASTTQPTLSFPPSTFAKLSPHPYLLAHLQPSSDSPSRRANGRQPTSFRKPHINTGSLTHAEGSAVVRAGDTTVVCGIRGEILLASDVSGYRATATSDPAQEVKELDLLVPNIELATGCNPAFLPGQPPSTLAQSLSTRMLSLLLSSKLVGNDGQLRIWFKPEKEMDIDDEEVQEEVKAFWTLYIDILFISLDGNAFDVAWAAVLAALKDVRLPEAKWDTDRGMILCSDELASTRPLNLLGLPISSTFVVFDSGKSGKSRSWILADPDTFEEGLCDESVTIVVDGSAKDTKILSISKAGGVAVGKAEMKELVQMAVHRWRDWEEALKASTVA